MAQRPAGAKNVSGNIIVCGRSYLIDAPVVNYFDNTSFSAYRRACYKGPSGTPTEAIFPFSPAKGLGQMASRFRERRLMGGKRDLSVLQQVVRQFVIHHDGCGSSLDCFHVLHDERGLSVHFLIDNDGTIYQTLDLADCAFQATGVNEISIGVELSSRGEVKLDGPEYYRKRGIKREITEITIHTSRYQMWEYTTEQYGSMFALGKALTRILPNLPQVYPQMNSDLVRTWITDPRNFAGYIGHYHVTNNKWDPGCFDFKRLSQKIQARATWFVCLDRGECQHSPEIADDEPKAEDQAVELVRNNEEDAMGGYFPVGPFGKSRLWHGGIHLSMSDSAPVFSPFPGKIVAARFGDDVAIGSRNFVLVKHSFNLAGKAISFYLLYFHLEREDASSARTPWFQGADKKPFYTAIQNDEVAFPDVEIAGGDLIGHAGQAGPPGTLESQVHVEVMSIDELGQVLQPGFWHPIDAGKSGHFCDVPEILGPIDRPQGAGDGLLTERELRGFFQKDDRRSEMRKLAVRFQSEWGQSPEYETALLRSKDFAKMPKGARARLFRDQVEPTLWWTQEAAQKTGLPDDYIVWHYHPVRFVAWMNAQLKKQSSVTAAKVEERKGPAADKVLDDRESLEGFTDDEDELSMEAGQKLNLEDLAKGYPEETKEK